MTRLPMRGCSSMFRSGGGARTAKAYLLTEDFKRFRNYTHAAWAEDFKRWCFRTFTALQMASFRQPGDLP